MVKLVIKAPNQKIDDCEVMAEMGWTVRQLKDHLSAHYPSRPATTDQRLIYSGHLMRDDQTLRQVFSSSSANEESGAGTVTLHLVCSNSATSSHTPTSSAPSVTVPTAAARTMPAPVSNQPVAVASPSRTGVTAAAAAAAASATTTAGSSGIQYPNLTAAFPLMAGIQPPLVWTPEQLALAHQMYQQFMSQLQANPAVLPSLIVPSLTTTATTSIPQIPIPVTAPIQAAAAAAAPLLLNNLPPQNIINNNNNNNNNIIVQNEPQQVPPAAPIRQDDDDDEDPEIREERDFLGWFYWMSRAVVLFSVVYFYSSLARLVVVILFAILMYIYQAGVFVPRNGAEELMQENDAVDAGDPAAGNPVHPEDPLAADMDRDDQQQQAAVAAGVRRRGSDETVTERNGFRMVWLVVSSLFTSLIPEQPPAHF